jgi:NAD-dependent dihydropyrimidine dehydrogenase PreA subunit
LQGLRVSRRANKPKNKKEKISEMNEKVYMVPNPVTPNECVRFEEDKCQGCNLCVEVCPTDVMMPNPQAGSPPIILYAEECWYCGGCVEECPEGAIRMMHPLSQNISVNWKRKKSGEYFRLGQRNPPSPNTRPPSGG